MPPRSSSAAMRRHWNVLCHEIGHRTAGTRGEQQAADYVASCMQRLGLENVRQEPFTFPDWSCRRFSFKTGSPGRRPTRRVPSARAGVYSLPTPRGSVRGPLAYLQSGSPLDFEQPLRGKIGLVIGTFAVADPTVKKHLARSGLKAVITVDMRVPFAWPTSCGAPPHWIDGLSIPMVGLPYLEAIKLVEQMPVDIEITLDSRFHPGTSSNVIGEIVGREKPEEVVIVSGHHDCVSENVGADDNGSGVIYTLELARMLSGQRRPRRTVRFISYGVEERLSIGAYLYMRSLGRAEQQRIVFVANADSISSVVGTDVIHITGTPALERFVRRTWARRKHPAMISASVHAFSDHFPFNIAGVPSISLGRPGIANAGCWQLHSHHDNTDHVSTAVLGRTIATSAALLDRIVHAPTLPFPRRIVASLAREVAATAKSVYRHPWSPDNFNYER